MTAVSPHAPDVTESLPVLSRLALSYAPASARGPTLALLALDARLAGLVRGSSEPLLAQLRLAWWRDTLGKPSAEWPLGEPLLALARSWEAERAALVALTDGWEALTGEAPLARDALALLADARAQAFAGLARLLGRRDAAGEAERQAKAWALADLAGRLGHEGERAAALDLAAGQGARPGRLPRVLRPLAVLHGLARRQLARGEGLDAPGPGALVAALRIGLVGR